MLFNSIDFSIFLPVVFLLYWFFFKKNLGHQNLLIVFASYLFYGWWDWRFLSLIVFSTITDYGIGIALSKEENSVKRKLLLSASVVVNIGLLGIFKYYDFFLTNFVNAFSFVGGEISARSLNIVLPVGISFYTFQTLSYSIDVYRRKLEPTRDFVAFSAFVSFFPQLVAGPIERATHLLPQFYAKRTFDYGKAVDGLRQILWGLFKKMVIADNCAKFVDVIFSNSAEYSGSVLVIGALFFAFQIYCDFSGYSDIAIGTSRLFGFDLRRNFAFPYFSRDIAEFWRRWHISLSTWFRDYVYIPLGGSRGGTSIKIRNTFIIFVVSGFWHGANWTFIVWGALNAIYFLPLLLTQNNRNHLDTVAEGKSLPSIREVILMLITFSLTTFAWVFFRADSIEHAVQYIAGMFRHPGSFLLASVYIKYGITLLLILVLIAIEWIGRDQQYAIARLGLKWKKPVRYAFYYSILAAIFIFGQHQQQFIYFTF